MTLGFFNLDPVSPWFWVFVWLMQGCIVTRWATSPRQWESSRSAYFCCSPIVIMSDNIREGSLQRNTTIFLFHFHFQVALSLSSLSQGEVLKACLCCHYYRVVFAQCQWNSRQRMCNIGLIGSHDSPVCRLKLSRSTNHFRNCCVH